MGRLDGKHERERTSYSPIRCGVIAGVTSQIVCHPMDTIRTRMQVDRYRSARHCFRHTMRVDGVRGLYKGLSAPLVAQGVYKAVIFSVQHQSASFMSDRGMFAPDSTALSAVSGGIAGAANAVFVTPVEFVRNRLQANYSRDCRTSPMMVVKEAISKYGIGSLFKGYLATVARDGPGVALYFSTFSTCRRLLSRAECNDTESLLFSSAFAGLAFWLWALPLDTAKTAIQASRNDAQSPSTIVRRLYVREGGIARFFRGWQVAYTRGIPGATVTLVVYQAMKDRGW